MILTIICTLVVYWSIGIVIGCINEEWLQKWAVGLVYPMLYALFYPIRAWKQYSSSETYYRKRNVSRLQYMFGKRIRE